jgi:Glycosyl transferase family 2
MIAQAKKLETKLQEQKANLMGFSKVRHLDMREPLFFADINIHLCVPIFAAIPWAYVNILLKDSSQWTAEWDSLLSSYDSVIEPSLLEDKALFLSGLKGFFDAAVSQRPTKGVYHCPPILTVQDCPPISIVTPTYNRRKLLDIAFHNLLATDYPQDKIEWVIVEDHEDSTQMASEKIMNFQVNNPKLKIKYIPIQGRMTIGQKRNIGVENSTNDIILFMDDDDHYPPTSFRRRVAWLTKDKQAHTIAFCTTIALYDLDRGVSAVNVPPYGLSLGARISEATLTFRKSVWVERPFEDISVAEGENWIKGRENQCVEIQPQQIIVAFSHSGNRTGRRIPPSDLKEVSCFWNFPKEYLVFIHGLNGVEVTEKSK